MQCNPIRMNWKLRAVLLAVTMTSLIGCDNPKAACWHPTPVQASSEAKEWLKAHEPLPYYLKEYLKAIGDEQEAIRANGG